MTCTTGGDPTASLTTTRGDSFEFKVRVWDDPDKTDPSDLTAAVVTAQLRTSPDAVDVEAAFHVALDPVESNMVRLSLLPTETAVLPQQTVWDVEVDWLGDGTSVQTIARGTLAVGPDVTRTA